MARPKRNASQAGLETATAATPVTKKGRRSNGRTVTETAAASRPKRSSASNGEISAHVTPKKRGSPPKAASAPTEPAKSPKSGAQKTSKTSDVVNGSNTPARATRVASAAQIPEGEARKAGGQSEAGKTTSKKTEARETAVQERRGSDFSVEIASDRAVRAVEGQDDEDEDEEGMSYWLMKAEPESRIEKGRDVKFSIDDLMNAKEPEGWDARNNMRAMRKGDLAFFYHSNTKVPGIAGVMEIVREHTTDGNRPFPEGAQIIEATVKTDCPDCTDTAFDPGHPYYDPKSVPDKPKWDMVHVEFRQKFDSLVKLKDLQKFSKPGGVLEGMQTLKQSRLSVSKVTKKEWEFIMSLADEEADPEALAQVPVEQNNPHQDGTEPTGALSATDNANPATDGGEDNPMILGPNGSLPDGLQEHDAAGEKEVSLERQSVANDKRIGNGVQAQKADGNAGRGSRKSSR